ncbi:aminomethyltransferase [Sarracenia purpurea var. burkii]
MMRGSGLWQLAQSITRHRRLARRCFAAEAGLKKTVLHDFHVANGGEMVPFFGRTMPLRYRDSIVDSALNCRENGGLFDISPLCDLISLKGKNCVEFLEKLVVADVAGLAPGTGALTVFTNEKGGVIDDSVISKVRDDHVCVVVNSGCRDKDVAHIEEHGKVFRAKGGDVSWHIHDETCLLALQGPLAAPVLQRLTKENLSKMYFWGFRELDINGIHCFLTRTGYTGEDGFEISVPSEHAADVAKSILEKLEGKPEAAGLCWYGKELEQHITPVEAGLGWTVGKRRRAEGGFLGAHTILKQLAEGTQIRRVGFFSTGGDSPPASHSEIQEEKGNRIGEVTSGGFSPFLKKNIGMGYVKTSFYTAGTKVRIVDSGNSYDGIVTKMPFVPTKYYRPS